MPASALWCLRLAVAAQCIAAARTAWVAGSAVNGWLFMRAGLPESIATHADQAGAVLLVAAAASLLFRPVHALVLVSAVWMAAVALATWANPETIVDSTAPLAHAVRVAAPLALVLLLPKPRGDLFETPPRSSLAIWILVLGTAATFTAHGLEALQHYGRFVDLLIGSAERWLGWSLSQSKAETILTVIGIQDMILAGLLILRRWRWVAGWMAIWGFATAISRVTAMGGDSWHDTVVRACNCGVPLALYLAWWQVVRPSTKSTHP